MKLLVILSTVAFVVDFVASAPEPPTDKPDAAENSAAAAAATAIETPKPFFDFNNFYHGAFPPARFPSSDFLPTPAPTFSSLNAFNYAPFRQGILPPISQVIPPHVSQIVPPISQIVPPIFGNVPAAPAAPPLPSVPAPVAPPQLLPNIPKTLFNKYAFPYARPLVSFPNTYTYGFPSTYSSFAPTYPLSSSFPFPSTFSFPPLPLQKQPPTTAQKESPPTSYGPPAAAPEEPESQGAAENSAPFEPSAVSYPYEAAAPEDPEPVTPHKPAQEYGPPTA